MSTIGIFIKQERVKQNMSQKMLAEGICSNTYLSKIELGQIEVHHNIIELLVDALGFEYNKDLKDFYNLSDSIWNQYFDCSLYDSTLTKEESDLIDSMYLTEASLDALLLRNFINVITNQGLEDDYVKVLSQVHYDKDIQNKHHIILCLVDFGNALKNPVIASSRDEVGIITYFKSLASFYTGEYLDCLKFSKKAYSIFSNNGKIAWMINSSQFEASSYSNLNNFDDFMKVNQRILSLNSGSSMKDESLIFLVEYNIGATYLMMNDYTNAETHLLNCITKTNYHSDLYFEKLCFLYLLKRNFKQARYYLKNIENDSSIKVLTYLCESENDIKSKYYVDILEEVYFELKQVHHGRSMFYKELLMEAYKANYMYPKALKLAEVEIKENHSYFSKN